METKFTSKQILNYAAAVFLAVLALGILRVLLISPWFKNIRAEITQQPYARTITISADGKVSAKPDLASVTLTVVSEKPTVKQVSADNNEKMNRVIDAIKKIGIEDKDITTSAYNLIPQYRYPTGGSPVLTGYSLRQEVTVKIRKLELVDDVLDSATKTGANEVGQLSFDIDDAGAVKKQARDQAFTKAREKAQDMATAAGVKLGRVVTFSESYGDYYPNVYSQFSYNARESVSNIAAPIQPGSKELNVNVSVTYEIE